MPEKPTRKRRLTRRGVSLAATLAAMMLALPALALAHLERPSYWPDPASRQVGQPAGRRQGAHGALAESAASGRGAEATCSSSARARGARSRWRSCAHRCARPARRATASVRASRRSSSPSSQARAAARHQRRAGGAVRVPLGPGRRFSTPGNNDRIVIMPGRYTEPDSRRAPVNDPKCNPSLLQRDASGRPHARATSTRSPAPTTRT